MSETTAVATPGSTAVAKLHGRFAVRFGVDESQVANILKATAFKVKDGVVTDAQMTALLIVADQYGLNPFTKEIFAFPDKQNGIVPVVGVDGWSRIINDNPKLDGLEFAYSEELVTPAGGKQCPAWCEVTIYRKDRSRPTVVREYLDEVYRPMSYSGPWQTHTKRFLRHKTLIQGARLAFGFAGIYDEDEANRIIEGELVPHTATGQATVERKTVQSKSERAKANEKVIDAEVVDKDTGEVRAESPQQTTETQQQQSSGSPGDKPATEGMKKTLQGKARNNPTVDLDTLLASENATLDTLTINQCNTLLALC